MGRAVRPKGGAALFLKGEDPYAVRKYDLVFTGGYSNPGKIYKSICDNMKQDGFLDLAIAFMDKLIRFPNKTYEAALQETLCDYGRGNLKDTQFRDLAVKFKEVNKYIRSYFRDKIIREIVDHDIQIHVSGNGWEEFESEHKENLIIESNDWYTGRKLVANAKIALNIMPWFKGGVHDRVVTGMLSGAVCLTDFSTYFEAPFTDMENIAIFYLDRLEELPAKIRYLLSHEEEAAVIAENGRKLAEQEFTWDKYASDMVQVLQEELNERMEPVGQGHDLLQIKQGLGRVEVAIDVKSDLDETMELLDCMKNNPMFGIEDYRYCAERLIKEFRKLVVEYPGLQIEDTVWDRMTDLSEENIDEFTELIRIQIRKIFQ